MNVEVEGAPNCGARETRARAAELFGGRRTAEVGVRAGAGTMTRLEGVPNTWRATFGRGHSQNEEQFKAI